MNLAQALRASQGIRLAMVGAGGKTTAMFGLARQLTPPVLVSATTHLAQHQLRFADRYFPIDEGADIRRLGEQGFSGVTLLIGKPCEDQRALGLSAEQIGAVYAQAEEHNLPLLVEADGSRQLPMKAPAAHEPAIPPWANTVMVVAGMSGLGKPLDSQHVHRPEIFAQLTGLRPSDPVTPEAVQRLLCHPLGGLKNIPDAARRVVLLNQVDDAALYQQAMPLAQSLLSCYPAVILAKSEGENSPARQDLLELSVMRVVEQVAGIVLAAGGSLRFGRPKALLDWHGQPFIRQVVQKALDAGLSPVVVVVGAVVEPIMQALQGLPVIFAVNEHWQLGQSESIRAGLQRLPAQTGAAIFLLTDQPQVSVVLLEGLVEAHRRSLSPIIAPRVEGQRTNPVLFDRQTFDDLRAIHGDVGGRALFSTYPVSWFDWPDRSLLMDVDTEADYARLMELGD